MSTTAYTTLGEFSTDDANWQRSTLGKAVQTAIVEMVRQVSARSATLARVSFAATPAPTEAEPSAAEHAHAAQKSPASPARAGQPTEKPGATPKDTPAQPEPQKTPARPGAGDL